MPTAKAQYKGDGTGTIPKDFSSKLKGELREYYPGSDEEINHSMGHMADAFVEEILAEARYAIEELHWADFEITKQELRTEHKNLLKTVSSAVDKLHSLSLELDNLLGVEADPLGCADKLSILVEQLKIAAPKINDLEQKPRSAEIQHNIAVEMTIRVLRVLKSYDIKLSATWSGDIGYTSDSILVLKAIGDDAGLCFAESTWRDTILEAKEAVTDLK